MGRVAGEWRKEEIKKRSEEGRGGGSKVYVYTEREKELGTCECVSERERERERVKRGEEGGIIKREKHMYA